MRSAISTVETASVLVRTEETARFHCEITQKFILHL